MQDADGCNSKGGVENSRFFGKSYTMVCVHTFPSLVESYTVPRRQRR